MRLNKLQQSPVDHRDWKFESILTVQTTFPSTFDLRSNLPPVRDQGFRGTCAAFSASCIKEYHEKKENPTLFSGYISPNSIYWYRSNKPQEGMFLRDVMKILTNQGASREVYFPYTPTTEPKTIPAAAVTDAAKFKISGYAQITTISAAKQAIMTSGPLLVAFPYYDNGTPMFWRPKGSILGGHAVTAVGWTEEGFIIRNSWGSDWNGNGHVIFPFTDWGLQWEVWSAVDATTILTPPPAPAPPAPKPAPKPGRPIRQIIRQLKR